MCWEDLVSCLVVLEDVLEVRGKSWEEHCEKAGKQTSTKKQCKQQLVCGELQEECRNVRGSLVNIRNSVLETKENLRQSMRI